MDADTVAKRGLYVHLKVSHTPLTSHAPPLPWGFVGQNVGLSYFAGF